MVELEPTREAAMAAFAKSWRREWRPKVARDAPPGDTSDTKEYKTIQNRRPATSRRNLACVGSRLHDVEFNAAGGLTLLEVNGERVKRRWNGCATGASRHAEG